MEYSILYGILLAQVLICLQTTRYIIRIARFFPSGDGNYDLKKYIVPMQANQAAEAAAASSDSTYIIHAPYEQNDFKLLVGNINECLGSHYRASKVPPVNQLETIAGNHSKKYDAIASVYASFPILIGLGGTILGLIYAFRNVEGDFIAAVACSAKIVFIGSLTGIIFSLVLNGIIAWQRVRRNERLILFVQFIQIKLSPLLPTLTDETMKIVSSQLNIFSQSFFGKFQDFGNEFQRMAASIREIHDVGIKSIIDRNSEIMVKLITNIDRLETLNDTTSAISFDPQAFKIFMDKSTALTKSNHEVLKNMEVYSKLFQKVNDSFGGLYNKVENGVITLGNDRNIINQLHKAMNDFAKTTIERTDEMNEFTISFKTKIETLFTEYHHALQKVSDKLVKNIQDNLDVDEYKSILQHLVKLSATFEAENENIKALSGTVSNLSKELSEAIPSLRGLETQVSNLSGTIAQKLPAACEQALDANRVMATEIIQRTYRKPRSWGEWTFQGFRLFLRLFSKTQ